MDRGVGATPTTTRCRASGRGGLGPPRLVIVAGALALMTFAVVFGAVGAQADAGRVVRTTDAAIAPSSCYSRGESGPAPFGRFVSVRCGIPEGGGALRCIGTPRYPACKVKLEVTVTPVYVSKHDLGAGGELGGESLGTEKCKDTTFCTAELTKEFTCGEPITAEAIGRQYARVGSSGQRERVKAKIRVHGELILEGYVHLSSDARLAREAAATCLAPQTAPLEVLVNGVPTDDPLTATPIASGYGNVSLSPPGATVRCPYGTDYRACFGTWQVPLGTDVTLTAMPDPTNRSVFVGWRGSGSFNCPSSSPTCTVTVGQASQVTAVFGAPIYKLTIDNSNPSAGAVVPSGFSNLGPTPDHIQCGNGLNDCTAYYPLVDAQTMPNFNGSQPLSLAQNGVITYDNQQWYIQFNSGCDQVNVVVDGSNRYTVCYYDMTSDRTITVSWTDTPP